MQSEKVGKRIREYREKQGFSQEYLAENVGISVTSVSNIERGRNYPKMEIFIKIANVLGVSTDLLLCDVVEGSNSTKSSELSDALHNIPLSKREQIYALIETILKD